MVLFVYCLGILMEIWEKVSQVVLRPFLVQWEVWQLGLLTYELVPLSIGFASLRNIINLPVVFLFLETQISEVFFDGEMSVVLRGWRRDISGERACLISPKGQYLFSVLTVELALLPKGQRAENRGIMSEDTLEVGAHTSATESCGNLPHTRLGGFSPCLLLKMLCAS